MISNEISTGHECDVADMRLTTSRLTWRVGVRGRILQATCSIRDHDGFFDAIWCDSRNDKMGMECDRHVTRWAEMDEMDETDEGGKGGGEGDE